MRLPDIRTYKNTVAVIAAIPIVAVLSLLIIESGAVENEYYVAHSERMRAVDSIETDVAAARGGMQSAFAAVEHIPLSVELAFARLLENAALLRDPSGLQQATPEAQAIHDDFAVGLRQFISNGQNFAKKQKAFVTELQSMQEGSPILVKALREGALPTQSQLVFSLAIDLIEFATAPNQADPLPLLKRIDVLQEDSNVEALVATRSTAFVNAARSIIKERALADASLQAVTNSDVTSDLSALSGVILSANQRTVGRAERARFLLSLCAVLLLIGAAYAIYRLQDSYRALNQSNAELEQANINLEERVAARTEQLSVANDELKESQSQLIHAEKMSSLGQMVAGISHEINTPLWYLMNNSSVIQERLDVSGELCEIAKSMVAAVRSRSSVNESIRHGLLDMHRLLEDGMEDDIDEAKSLIKDSIFGLDALTTLAQGLKDFSRLDRANEGQFNVNDGLDKALLIASNKLKNRVSVHKFYADVPSVYCAPSQINQIFLNLLTNAADAIENTGDLVIQTWEGEGQVGISISDTGSGIPADVLPKIRDPFFTTKEVGKGTGLGLSIVDQIVTMHNGEFRIESEAGEGTTVTIILPIFAPVVSITEKSVDEVTKAVAQRVNVLSEDVPRVMSA